MRIGYARASTVRQSLNTQLDSLWAAGVCRVFGEKVSTRATTHPELDNAVTLVMHEHKRLGRGTELAALHLEEEFERRREQSVSCNRVPRGL